jgi:hypothetical protein
MELIKRYLHALAEYLPAEGKEEILKEVEANIYDMLQNDFSEENVNWVLTELGDPAVLSRNYKGKQQYLIGPDYYDNYIRTLKLVCPLVAVISFILAIIPVLLSSPGADFGDVISDFFSSSISSALEGALTSAFIITVVFVIIEKCGAKDISNAKGFKKEPWTPSKLANVPADKPYRFKTGDIIAEIIFSVIGTAVFFTFAPKFGWYTKVDESLELVVLLFNANRIYYYLGFAVILLVCLLILDLFKLKAKYPDYKTAVMVTVYKVLSMVYGLVMVHDTSLLNVEFRTKASQEAGMTFVQYDRVWSVLVGVITAIIVISTIVDIIQIFYHSYKNEKASV